MDNVLTALGFLRAALLDSNVDAPDFTWADMQATMNLAYRRMRDRFMIATEDTEAEYVVQIANFPQGTNDLSAYLQPGEPLDNMIAPITLMEKQAGADPQYYQETSPVDQLPVRAPQNFLYEYEWRTGNCFFLGATQNLDLQVRYEGTWPSLKAESDPLAAHNTAQILGLMTAGLYPLIPTATAQAILAQADDLGFAWMNRQVKKSQENPARQRQFRPKRGGFAGLGSGPFF